MAEALHSVSDSTETKQNSLQKVEIEREKKRPGVEEVTIALLSPFSSFTLLQEGLVFVKRVLIFRP